MNCLKTLFCGYLLYASVLAGYAGLFCPLLPVLFLSNRLYRFLTDLIVALWQLFPAALIQLVCKVEVEVYGDVLEPSENVVVVMNHRTRPECLFLWNAMYHSTKGIRKYTYPLRFVLKDVFRHVPGQGWIMQLSCFLYLKREWNCDEEILREIAAYFCDMSYKSCISLFPEGTVLSPENAKVSNTYADKYHLPKYDYILHPKTTGFAFLVEQLMARDNLDAVYDITSVYPDAIPQCETSMLAGTVPKRVKFHFKKYPRSELPTSDQGLRTFLENCWSEKEKILREFYTEGRFLEGQRIWRTNVPELYVALVFWTLLPYIILYYLYVYNWFKFIVFVHTVFLFYLNYIRGYGFQRFEVQVYKFKKSIFGVVF